MITRAPFTAGTAQAQQFESGSVGWSPNTVIPPWSACAGTADLLITREWAILAGENDYTTDTFQQITGPPAPDGRVPSREPRRIRLMPAHHPARSRGGSMR
jgi:hypothetical protein